MNDKVAKIGETRTAYHEALNDYINNLNTYIELLFDNSFRIYDGNDAFIYKKMYFQLENNGIYFYYDAD